MLIYWSFLGYSCASAIFMFWPTVILATNGTFMKSFKYQDVYKLFYELAVHLKDCGSEDSDSRVKLQNCL